MMLDVIDTAAEDNAGSRFEFEIGALAAGTDSRLKRLADACRSHGCKDAQ